MPETLLQDLRYGARTLLRTRGFTAVAVLALALGIGVNTAVFTAYKAMVARPFDAKNLHQLVNIALIRQSGDADFRFSYPDYETYRDSAHTLSGLIAFSPDRMRLTEAGNTVTQRAANEDSQLKRLGLLTSGAGNAEFASTYEVSENYFQVLGVQPIRGRAFESMTKAELSAAPAVLISDNYWQKRFGGDPAILGKTIRLNGASLTIIGITPHDFVGTHIVVPDFWLPLSLDALVHPAGNRLRDRENRFLRFVARLAPGVSDTRAQTEINVITDRVRGQHDPGSDTSKPATAIVWPGSPFPLPISQYRGLELAIALIMAAAVMVLVIACANVASLQLARARSRENELRTRLSLGASRLRIVRQLLTESALLGVISGSIALPFTWALLQTGANFAAKAFPADMGTLIFHVSPDLAIFTYVLAISMIAGILFGLAPAIESSRSNVSLAVRTGATSLRGRRLQDLLITAQVALSLVLMIAGSLFIRTSIHALNAETGYDAKHVIALTLQFPEATKYTAAHKLAIVRELRTRLAAVPGVAAVTSAQTPDNNFSRTTAVGSLQSAIYYTAIEPNYFETVGIPLFLGRNFGERSERAVILSESAARQLWPGQNAVGRVVRLNLTDNGGAYQVIGVARDTRGIQFDGSDSKRAYLPSTESQLPDSPILIRTRSGPAQVTKAIDVVLAATDADLVAISSTLDERLHQSGPFIVSALAAAVATTVGLFGLLLASMGIYGTVAYIVVLRTREVGIRMAIGAQKRNILGLILRESTRPVFAGLFIGLLFAAGAFYLLRGVFYGINPIDGFSFTVVSALFLVIALLAAYPPARRAMRVDPMVALRYE